MNHRYRISVEWADGAKNIEVCLESDDKKTTLETLAKLRGALLALTDRLFDQIRYGKQS